MKSFNNWLLLEREFDRSMREAGGKTFDRMHKTIMQIIKKGVDNYFFMMKDRPVPNFDSKDPDQYRRELSEFVHSLTVIGSFQSGSKISLNAEFYNMTYSFRYRMKDRGELFFPPHIKFKDFEKYLKNSIGLMEIVFRSPYGGEGFGGTYKTGRKDASFQIDINNFATLYVKDDSPLGKTFKEVVKLRAQGKSANAIVRPINKWLSEFNSEFGTKREIFVHEYIHFLDDMRYKSASDRPGNIEAGIIASRDSSDPLKRKYYMSDAEMNAYFQGAASEIEDAVESFLIGATTNRAAAAAISKHNMMIPRFNAQAPQAKTKMVGDAVVDELYKKIDDALGESWVPEHIMKMLDISPAQTGLKGLPLFCLALVSWYSFSTSLLSFEDPKNRKKLLTRIVLFADELKQSIEKYRTSMAQGKVPSSQEFNKATAKFKPGGYPTKSKAAYNILYSGFMIDKKVYDPRKPFEGT
jgi:hypothetical protein